VFLAFIPGFHKGFLHWSRRLKLRVLFLMEWFESLNGSDGEDINHAVLSFGETGG